MDPQRMRDVYERLQLLEDRLGHRVRPARGGSMGRATPEQLEERVRDLAHYTTELRQLVEDLVTAIGSRPAGSAGESKSGG
jgi:hypothetical protein